MNNNSGMKHSSYVLLITIIAVIYSLSVIGCSFFVSGEFISNESLYADNSSMISDNQSKPPYFVNGNASDVESNSSNTSSVDSSLESNTSNNSSENESNISSNVSSEGTSSNDTPSENLPSVDNSSNNSSDDNSGDNTSVPDVIPPVTTTKQFTNAMWISFYELDFKGLNEAGFKNKINTMLNDAVALKCDALFIHVRPYADAYYRSSLFPMSAFISGTQGVDPGYDPLKYIISAGHERGLQIHAWINPYRVLNSTDTTLLADNNKAKIWLNDEKSKRNVLTHNNFLYFNPTKSQVRQLVIDGVREILDNYDVDGIHFDDYFYPTTDPLFDKQEYDEYLSASPNNKLSQDDWRRANVSALVQGVYSVVKQYSGVVFGISPSYSISKDNSDLNYNTHYADVATWMNSDGFIDYITPQLYFGYEYPKPECRYNYLLDLWLSMPRNKNVKIYIGLASYKMDEPTNQDGDEWQTEDDLLSRQIIEAYTKGADGFCIFSYGSITSNKTINKAQRENLLQALEHIANL